MCSKDLERPERDHLLWGRVWNGDARDQAVLEDTGVLAHPELKDLAEPFKYSYETPKKTIP